MELAAIRSSNLSFSIPFNPTSRHTLSFAVTPKTGSLIPRRVRNARFSLARNPTKESKKRIQDLLKCNGSSDYYHCPLCCRRHFLGAVLGTGLLPITSSSALDNESTFQDSMAALNRIHPPRPEWYEEFYASSMDKTMISYEAEIAGFKSQLFSSLRGKVDNILEIGIGTGPNLRYYADNPGINVAEALPVNDASVDAVVGTLVLCSVKDVTLALQEVRRVLKPGGYYIFVEHVAAKDGTVLRFVQGVLDPLQQIVADGCHLTRNTGTYIARAGFTSLDINQASVSTLSIISPHVYGIARR
ncbi:methyltransferase-like protein 7B [Dorcoceras hygrometricum]|uniref:Methyltransferase-like protein 7B n=1 Tax=Dorcoceras hygrometricum TaxID=472368 RepID=A0A2Z7BIT3_9LAMI|nr:methyltransferase-like protein 7B [Dorcoceras hygrometricum]